MSCVICSAPKAVSRVAPHPYNGTHHGSIHERADTRATADNQTQTDRQRQTQTDTCLLYTSDAADDM
eukprot:797872-Alexandrium_andersonii.AAC.1